ncbi:MAG: FAD-dependent oxidoreductase [Syntrophobacterales bacterium]|jgi:heterodisulfide reductase subunit A|nr:FAD-dependent oxidoreductase [Syntrophobacterales bacterium]
MTAKQSKQSAEKIGAVAVVGGGIAGLQAALDLAESGFYVYLVEKKPAIGGVMPQLDKTFPTNDCSMCTLAPKLVEVGRHLNIEILAPAEVTGISGKAGNFSVEVVQKARYIDESKCIACGICAEKCPKKVPNEFNEGLNNRKAAYVLYPQAVPLKYAIDRDHCIYFKNGKCKACEKFCPAQAVDFSQTDHVIHLDVGSVILSPGFQVFDARLKPEYGYGRYPNVVTSLEYERILSATGPTEAHIKRPSDGAEPEKIAWIQCVGSRDAANGRPYCSSVCCMYATKQAIISQEHDAKIKPTIFFIDLRAHGKGFETYYQEAKKHHNIRYLRAMVSRVTQNPRTKNLELSYVDEINGIQTEEFDLVVLSVGMRIPQESAALAEILRVEISQYNFVETSCCTPVATSQPGIFACGAFTGPKDIPDSVMQGSAAAAAAARDLAASRGTMQREKSFPPEIDVADEPPRVGVFVCHCGMNIGGIANVPALVESARLIPNVEYAQDNLFTCSQDSQNQMVQVIKEHKLNRVVVAACSPTTHAPMFQNMLREAGVNKYLFEMANIRNQCTWVHQAEPEKATAKCEDLIRMGVAKARMLAPLKYLSVPVNKRALVVGGGMSGMTSALALADQGFEVHLVERLDRLAGNARKLHSTWRDEPVQAMVDGMIEKVEKQPRITVHYLAMVDEVSGSVGNFKSKLSTGQEIEHGIVIIAVGAEPLRPEGQYLYKQHPNVLLSLDLDRELARGTQRVKEAQGVAFIQCVGSRIPERPYCNRVCCSHSVENAIRLKTLNPEMDVFIIYRDMRTYGERETLYATARELGVRFLRYSVDDLPVVEAAGDKIIVRFVDQDLLLPVELSVDLLTLATAIIPHQNAPLADLYKVHLNAEGFYTEAHAKIKPVEASTAGIYMAGLCHYPKPIEESIAEALACASRAGTVLSRDTLELESIISRPIDENCDGCAFCVDACPFHAISLLEYVRDGNVKKTVEVSPVLCKGCGSCMATCPKQGIYVAGFTLPQLEAQVDALLGLN